jgi:hypothetical protein
MCSWLVRERNCRLDGRNFEPEGQLEPKMTPMKMDIEQTAFVFSDLIADQIIHEAA